MYNEYECMIKSMWSSSSIWAMAQQQKSWTWKSNYTYNILWDVITYSYPRHMYVHTDTHRNAWLSNCVIIFIFITSLTYLNIRPELQIIRIILLTRGVPFDCLSNIQCCIYVGSKILVMKFISGLFYFFSVRIMDHLMPLCKVYTKHTQAGLLAKPLYKPSLIPRDPSYLRPIR